MAADLVLKSSIPQTFVHDLESAFWVMIWVALLYLPSNWDATDRLSFIRGTMNPPVFRGSGGFNKIHYMQSGRSLSGLRFDSNEILDQLLSNLKMALAVRHQDRPTPNTNNPYARPRKNVPEVDTASSGSYATAEHNKLLASLKDHQCILELIHQHLLSPSWPESDAAKYQPVLQADDAQTPLNSSSKRPWDVVELDGGFHLAPLGKRSEQGSRVG
jgi:hypothetical protein